MKRVLLITLILASLILSGCGAAATPAPQLGAPSFSGGAPIEAPAATSAQAAEAPLLQNDALNSPQNGASTTGSDVTPSDTQRLVVQTAELTIVVQDVKTRVSQIE